MKLKATLALTATLLMAGCTAPVAKQTMVSKVESLDNKIAVAVVSGSGTSHQNTVIKQVNKVFDDYRIKDVSYGFTKFLRDKDDEAGKQLEGLLRVADINHVILIVGAGTQHNEKSYHTSPAHTTCNTSSSVYSRISSTNCTTTGGGTYSTNHKIENDTARVMLINVNGDTLFEGEYQSSSSRTTISQLYLDSAAEKIIKEFRADLEANGFIQTN